VLSAGSLSPYAVAGVALVLGGLFLLPLASERASAWLKQLPRSRKVLAAAGPTTLALAFLALLAVVGGREPPAKVESLTPSTQTSARDGWAEAFIASAKDDALSLAKAAAGDPSLGLDSDFKSAGGGGGASGSPGSNPRVGGRPGGGGENAGQGQGNAGSPANNRAQPDGGPSEATSNEGAAPDRARPVVARVSPSADEKGVSPEANVQVTFSEAMRGSTLNAKTVTLEPARAGNPEKVEGTVRYDPDRRRATLNPDRDLRPGEYTATVTTGAMDLAGNHLADPKRWSFSVER
jgi:Bacterial Ig-like domain